MSLKHIKNKIRSTERTHKVTKAMEAVSAVKMRKSQDRALKDRQYALAALRVFKRISQSAEARGFTLGGDISKGKTCVIAITSDKGLAGNLNNAVLKEVDKTLSEIKGESVCICFGRKAYEHLTNRGYDVSKHYLNVSDDVGLEEMREVAEEVVANHQRGDFARVVVIHQSFVSTFEQVPKTYQLLPLSLETIEEVIADIGGDTVAAMSRDERTINTYTVEPDAEKVFEAIFPQLVQVALYHALLESKASEHSARMVAMKNASDKAVEVGKELTLKFNKERQSVITREVSEIVGGIEAMAQK